MDLIKLIPIILCLFLSSSVFAVERPQRPSLDDRISKYLEQYRKHYPGPITFPNTPNPTAVAPITTNEEQAALYPNENEPSIQDTHAQSMKGTLIDNRTSAVNVPNQSQPSNQDMINSRLNGMGQ